MFFDNNLVFIPQELVDRIIDNLQDDIFSLRKCALVSKSWTPLSRRYLFRTLPLRLVKIAGSMPSQAEPTTQYDDDRLLQHERATGKCATLLACLDHAPYVASYVKSLYLRPGSYISTETGWQKDTTLLLVSILRKLCAVTTLILDLGRWSDYSLPIRDAILSLTRLPSLTVLRLANIILSSSSMLPEFLLCSSNLKNLIVSDVVFPADGAAPELATTQDPDNGERACLRELYLYNCVDPFYRLLVASPSTNLCVDNLHTLFISSGQSVSQSTAPFFAKLVNVVARNLEFLSVEIRSVVDPTEELSLTELDNLPNLKTLQLDVLLPTRFDQAASVIDLFRRVTMQSKLQCLRLSLRNISRGTDNAIPAAWDSWGSLDELVARSEFSHLNQICYSVAILNLEEDVSNRVKEKFESLFPRFLARDGCLLNVDVVELFGPKFHFNPLIGLV